ncbi:MAG: phosphoglycerate kinase [Paracoccaceae bacterium]
MKYNTIKDFTCTGKRVLVRVDLNVPFQDFKVSDNTRLKKIKPNLDMILENGGKPVIIGHIGRPSGNFDQNLSTENIVFELEKVLKLKVIFCDTLIGSEAIKASKDLQPNSILVLENTRFYSGEENNDPEFSKQLAKLGDLYCNDAFSVCHRAHASTVGITKFLPSFAGGLVLEELSALDSALTTPKKPVTAIIGGSKVSTKIELLQNLISKVENIIIGGGMANTFLLASGKQIGISLCEPTLIHIAQGIIENAEVLGCKIHLPDDVVTSKTLDGVNKIRSLDVNSCPPDEMIFDCGEKSVEKYLDVINLSKTIVWNGPLGAFEKEPFHLGTEKLAKFIAKKTIDGFLNSVAGGGDTVAALNKYQLSHDMSYVSTAGGAFLEWLEGKNLPGLEALEKKLN